MKIKVGIKDKYVATIEPKNELELLIKLEPSEGDKIQITLGKTITLEDALMHMNNAIEAYELI